MYPSREPWRFKDGAMKDEEAVQEASEVELGEVRASSVLVIRFQVS
jgi:hypothetical protein